MRILGVDPGTLRTGFGVIDLNRGNYSVIDYGCISNSAKSSLPLRFQKIYTQLTKVIEKIRPDCFAIESLFYCKNPNTAFKLGEARGVALLVAAQNNLDVFEYEPRRVKQAVVGFGSAHKIQVRNMVTSILKLNDIKGPEDVTDALAVAICHAHQVRTVGRIP
jgi:crossover junction endodeoxyribonuclease RuvC